MLKLDYCCQILKSSLKLIKVDSLNINSYPVGALYIYVNTMFIYIHGVIYNTPNMPPRRGQNIEEVPKILSSFNRRLNVAMYTCVIKPFQHKIFSHSKNT